MTNQEPMQKTHIFIKKNKMVGGVLEQNEQKMSFEHRFPKGVPLQKS